MDGDTVASRCPESDVEGLTGPVFPFDGTQKPGIMLAVAGYDGGSVIGGIATHEEERGEVELRHDSDS